MSAAERAIRDALPALHASVVDLTGLVHWAERHGQAAAAESVALERIVSVVAALQSALGDDPPSTPEETPHADV